MVKGIRLLDKKFDKELKRFFLTLLVLFITWIPGMLLYSDEWIKFYLVTVFMMLASVLVGWQGRRLDRVDKKCYDDETEEK